MPKKASLGLLEIEQLRNHFSGILNTKRLAIRKDSTLLLFRWHFTVIPKALSSRPNITFPP